MTARTVLSGALTAVIGIAVFVFPYAGFALAVYTLICLGIFFWRSNNDEAVPPPGAPPG